MNNYLVFLEQRGGVVKKASLDLWNTLQEFAALHKDCAVHGILAGPADAQYLDSSLSGQGTVHHAAEERFSVCNAECYVRLVADIFAQEACCSLFFADTVLGRELAPKLSVRLDASLLSGALITDEVSLRTGCRRSVYAGSATASFFPEKMPAIYIVPHVKPSSVLTMGKITLIPFVSKSFVLDELLFPFVRSTVMRDKGQDIAEADIIVAGGRGMGSADGFLMLEKLAGLLGGAVGASRVVVDEGWRPHSEQIGQTGKTVTPRLYFACGISGSLQHLAGIGTAVKVVAINSDRHAPIFDVADYGIVGDVHHVLPVLFDAVQDFLKKR